MQALSIQETNLRLRVSEIFWSFQGEGQRVGVPSIFLRLTGCVTRCTYCDTKYAWENGEMLGTDDIISKIDQAKKKYPDSQVVITGGEPMEQNLSEITHRLKGKNYFVSIETNGKYYQNLDINWWTVSPKDKNNFLIHNQLIEKINEVKLIVNGNLNIEIIKRIRDLRADFPIFLQPQASDKKKYKNTHTLFHKCQESGIQNIKPGFQLHKIYGTR